MKTTSAPSRTARWTVWPVRLRRSVITGSAQRTKLTRPLDRLTQLEEADPEIELVAVSLEEALPDKVGHDPRHGRLRKIGAAGQL